MAPSVIVLCCSGPGTNRVEWLTNPKARISSHVVISRTGGITQLVPFFTQSLRDKKCSWGGSSRADRFSIFVEFENDGPSDSNLPGTLYDEYRDDRAYWEMFPFPQLGSGLELCRALMAEYGRLEITTQSNVSIWEAKDPGPMFPFRQFRAMAYL